MVVVAVVEVLARGDGVLARDEAAGLQHRGDGGAADGHADADHGDGHFGAVPHVEDGG